VSKTRLTRLPGACAPRKTDPTSRRNFFEPVFMVQPAENILRSYPAIGWQLMPMNAWPWPSTARIRDSGAQACMWSSMIVAGNHSRRIVGRCCSFNGIT